MMRLLKFIVPVLTVVLGLLLPSLHSCQQAGIKSQIQQLDSLDMLLDNSQHYFKGIVDEDFIEARNDTMLRKIRYIEENYGKYHDTVSFEVQMLLTDYTRGIQRNYKEFLKEFPVLRYEQQEHRERLETLREDVLEGRIGADEFDDIYKREREVLEHHKEEVVEAAKLVVDLEQNFRRTDKLVNEIYDELRAKEAKGQ